MVSASVRLPSVSMSSLSSPSWLASSVEIGRDPAVERFEANGQAGDLGPDRLELGGADRRGRAPVSAARVVVP